MENLANEEDGTPKNKAEQKIDTSYTEPLISDSKLSPEMDEQIVTSTCESMEVSTCDDTNVEASPKPSTVDCMLPKAESVDLEDSYSEASLVISEQGDYEPINCPQEPKEEIPNDVQMCDQKVPSDVPVLNNVLSPAENMSKCLPVNDQLESLELASEDNLNSEVVSETLNSQDTIVTDSQTNANFSTTQSEEKSLSQADTLPMDVTDDKEEGELEEGELEDDDDDDVPLSAQQTPIVNLLPSMDKEHSQKQDSNVSGKRKHSRSHDAKEKSSKRKHRDKNHEEKRKKRKLNEEKDANDFDSLLKKGLQLVAGVSTSEDYEDDDDENDDDESGSDEGRRRHWSPRRKDICSFYLQGNCQSGASCQFSHDIGMGNRKLELCKFYMMDCCAKKDKCLYMHKDFPCKYYHFGMKCRAGESCKFSHNLLQEPTKNILLKHIELAPKDILGDFPRLSKHMAQIILNITLDKINGIEVDDAVLETTLEMEGLGFKYLDRAIRSLRKRTGIPKFQREPSEIKPKEDEKQKSESSPRKSKRSSDNDDRKEADKDKPRDRDRDRYRDRHRDRDKDRHRDRRDRKRDRESTRNSKDSQESKSRDSRYRDNDERKTVVEESRDPRLDKSSWYSSDDDSDARKNKYNNTPQPNRDPRTLSNDIAKNPDLDNIDVSYLQNLLQTVNNASSQNSSERSQLPEPQVENSYRSYQSQYENLSEDLQEVFDSPAEPIKKPNRTLSDDLAQLIKTVKEKTSKMPVDPPAESQFSGYNSRMQSDVPMEKHKWDTNPDKLSKSLDPRDTDLRSTFNRKELGSSDVDLRTIYDIDLRELQVPDDLQIPFNVPMSLPAVEIDASIRTNGSFHYQLIAITIPKPDFSTLKISRNDPKNTDDPRLRKIFENNDSPILPIVPSLSEPATVTADIPNRDPRSLARSATSPPVPQSDPRTRGDPRVRADPRNKDSAMSDPVPEANMDPIIPGIPYRHMDPYFSYPNMGPPFMPPGIDPRGRPGLLGPAPGHKPLISHVGNNAYMLGMGFQGDRNAPPRPMWNSNQPYNEH